MTKTKFEVMDICNPLDIPVGPILSLKELAEDQGLRDTNTIVEVDHPERGKYLTVVIQLSYLTPQQKLKDLHFSESILMRY